MTALKTLIALLQSKIGNLESGRINDDQLEDFAENIIPLQYRKLCYDLKCTFPSLRKLSEIGSEIPTSASITPLGVKTASNISTPVIADTPLIEDKLEPLVAVHMNVPVDTNSSTAGASITTTSSSTINTPVNSITAVLTDNTIVGTLATDNTTTAIKPPNSNAATNTNVSSSSSLPSSTPAQVGRKRKMSHEIPDTDSRHPRPLESPSLSTSNSRKNSIIKDNKENSQLSSSSPGKTSNRKLRGSSIDDDVSLNSNGLISGKKNKGIFSLSRSFTYVLSVYARMYVE
jgi:hypothetical protein